jgi:HNH endonuclease
MATPLHRHQSSFEGFIDLSPLSPLKPDLRSEGTILFNRIISYYEPSQSEGPYTYKPITLIRVTHEHVVSQDNFLNTFFLSLENGLSLENASPTSDFSKALSHFKNFESWDRDQREKLATDLAAFAKYLIDHFFLPRRSSSTISGDRYLCDHLVKASARRTPQPTPAPVSGAQTPQQVTGITQRISVLRRDCLRRDHHRCVITRSFDTREALERIKREGDSAADDDGQLLKDETERSEYLEVAHILPHSLMTQSGQTDLVRCVKIYMTLFHPHLINREL